MTSNGCSLDPKKTQGLVAMKEPKNERQVRRFLGGANFYCKMWRNRSHALAPLTELAGSVPFILKEINYTSCNEIKAIMSKETMLCHPNYDLPFLMSPDASDMQLGTHMSQIEAANVYFENFDEVLKYDHFPALLHSQKLNNYQKNCTATDKELLSIADALVEHDSILRGEKTHACSDHENITHLSTTHASTKVQRYRLLLEEFMFIPFHIPGENNELADALQRLPMTELDKEQEVEKLSHLIKACECTAKLPATLSVIKKHQKDSNQDWKDTRVEKRRYTKLR